MDRLLGKLRSEPVYWFYAKYIAQADREVEMEDRFPATCELIHLKRANFPMGG